ncbi:diguanylate cyclase [Mycobacterium sp. KBS0706]|uniref:diguanylate cyclase domain-containing protein n=1 Tax=Mycobacterium sp. KBS0706 TaxID=2578109 RepID=UPI00110FA7D5|nr:diguanylate cyclase [Mycobacterium sp. KBS0706]TSD87012.1 diguanylate cyclase [Mycobacterium sp. KBS0706]
MRAYPRDVLEATGLTFVLAVVGIATKGVEPLALFWPANAALIGWFLRRPNRPHPLCWAGVIVAFVAADLCYGRSIQLALVLLLANLAEIVTGVLFLAPMGPDDRELAHPQAVLRVTVGCVLLSLAGGIASALGFAWLGDPAILLNTATWWMSGMASVAAILPVALTIPARPWRLEQFVSAVRQEGPELIGPMVLLVIMAVVGAVTGGIGTTGFLLLPLIWSAMRCGIFVTTVLAALAGLWIFAALGLGLDRLPSHTLNEDPLRVLLTVRLSVALVALAAVLVASIMAGRRRVEARLAESERRLALVFEGTNDGIWDLDVPSGQLAALNASSLVTRSQSAPRRPFEEWLSRMHPEDRDRVAAELDRHLAGGSPGCVVEYRWPSPDDGWIWLLARGRAVERDHTGRPVRLVGSFMDVTARKALEQRIEHMANHDALTELANRHALDAALRERIAAYQKDGSRTLLMVLDLDGFKAVNDGHGHLAGDTVLRVLARRLRDEVPGAMVAARIGGDEFAIVGPDPGAGGAEALARQIGEALAAPIQVGDAMVSVGASFGWAFLPDDAKDDGGLSAIADTRLYAAKERDLRPGLAIAGRPLVSWRRPPNAAV